MNLSLIELTIFIIASIFVIAISWRTLFNCKSHGFYRFLSWECILLLFTFNYKFWFVNPFSLNQIISWLFLIYSLILLIPGLYLMKVLGKSQFDDRSELYKFEKTSKLIENGVFKFVRHPMYGSLLFLTWGILFKRQTSFLLIISIISTILLIITAKIEEKENVIFFGEKYNKYMKRSKMFIPYIF